MKKYSSEVYGNLPSPDTIEDLLELIKQHSSEYRNVYFWRGQADIAWLIHSSAYRRLKRTNKEVTEQDMQRYESYLLNHATHQGYRFDNGRELRDLELLGKLQHHGAATRFIDCSRNLLVGLWFACSSEPDKNGLLFGFHSSYVGGNENTLGVGAKQYEVAFESIDKLDHPLVWHPPVVTKRIASQNSQFIYSKVVDGSFGSLDIQNRPETYIAINISPEFKEKAIKDLTEIFDIRYITLFPDIDGFGHASSFRFDRFGNERW